MSKREREDASPLCVDMALHMHHNDPVAYGIIAPWDLRHWHSTCRDFYSDWCRVSYITALIDRAIVANERAYNTHGQQAVHWAGWVALHNMRRVVLFGEAVMRLLLPPQISQGRCGAYVLDMCLYVEDKTKKSRICIKEVFTAVGSGGTSLTSNATEKKLSLEWNLVCKLTTDYTAVRYGWQTIYWRDEKPLEHIVDLLSTDVVMLRLDPSVYRRSSTK